MIAPVNPPNSPRRRRILKVELIGPRIPTPFELAIPFFVLAGFALAAAAFTVNILMDLDRDRRRAVPRYVEPTQPAREVPSYQDPFSGR